LDKAQKVIDDAAANVERRTGVLRKAETSGAEAEKRAQKAIQSFGAPQTPTQVGQNIRSAVEPIFTKLKSVRATNAETNKTEAFNDALKKEERDKRFLTQRAFKEAVSAIDSAIKNPETKLRNVSIQEVESQLLKVKRALDPRKEVDGVVIGEPVSFEGLENLRRFLRDRAYGLPAEGFDAIGQQQAGKLADAVEKIQREFSPKIGKFLEQYKADSEPLRNFKTKLGEAIVGKEEFDMNRFATDPAELANKFFKSQTSVKDLVTLLGGDIAQAEKVARSYLADRIRKGTAKDVEKVIDESRDWIGQFPALQQQLSSIAREMGIAERVAGKRGVLAKALRTDLAALPLESAQKEAAKISSQAQTESEKRVQRGLKQATELRQRGQELAKTPDVAPVEEFYWC